MAPYEAVRHLVRNNVDYLPIDEIEGRVAVTLFVVYPPGIATIVPGERLGAKARAMINYLKVFERSSNLFQASRRRSRASTAKPTPPETSDSTPMLCANRARRRPARPNSVRWFA
jgi:arginine/lysine/ornithine decarboxylase